MKIANFLFLVAAIISCADQSRAAPKPNIIVILVDDMGFPDIGYYGSEIPAPNLGSLAAGGLRSTRFYSTGRCCPTGASLLTGLSALYCAISHRLDQNIDRLVEHLRAKGILENTIIVFLSDNGSTKERNKIGMWPAQTIANCENRASKGGWFYSLGMAWANVYNTPFRQIAHVIDLLPPSRENPTSLVKATPSSPPSAMCPRTNHAP